MLGFARHPLDELRRGHAVTVVDDHDLVISCVVWVQPINCLVDAIVILKQFADVRLLHKSSFLGGVSSLPHRATAQIDDVIRRSLNAAIERFSADRLDTDDCILGRAPQRRAVVIHIDDALTDQQDALILGLFQQLQCAHVVVPRLRFSCCCMQASVCK